MNESLKALSEMEGITGLCVHRGGIIKWQRLPDSLSNDQAGALCSAISRAFTSYASAERPLSEAWFGFGSQHILVITRPPETPGAAPDTFVTLLLSDRSAAPAAAKGALEFLKSGAVR
jgi:hypothetical protein